MNDPSPLRPRNSAWRIHTGPFPLAAPDFEGVLWLWRITDGDHFTAVVVKLSAGVAGADRVELTDRAWAAVMTRGRSAVEGSFGWEEPPREICFDSTTDGPAFWGGRRGGAHLTG
jgi:hypothetical protein